MRYYYRISEQKKLNPNHRLAILYKIRDKYRGSGLDLSKVEKEIKLQESLLKKMESVEGEQKVIEPVKVKEPSPPPEAIKVAPAPKIEKPVQRAISQPVVVPDEPESVSEITTSEHVIEVGDILSVIITPAEELSRDIVVNPDGTITFPFVGSILVRDMTIERFKTELTERLSQYIIEPQVSVSVKHFGKKRIYITGEVRSPGAYPYTPGLSLMELITTAGGFTELAEKKAVRIHRRVGRRAKLIDVNVEDIIKTGDLSKDVELHPRDVVEVPRGAKGIYVVGEVKHIGGIMVVPYAEGLTVSKAVSYVGGPTFNADLARVRITREVPKRKVITVNLKKVYAGDLRGDVLLQPGDVIYVPPSALGAGVSFVNNILPWLSAIVMILWIRAGLGI